jgi:hypothetical protein
MENVYIATNNQGITFNSPPTSIGNVSMGAVFASGAHLQGTIRANQWLNNQRPQLIANEYVHMNFIVDMPVSTNIMGALFHGTGVNSNTRVNISVGGHDFHGMVFCSGSNNSSSINGHANFIVPPLRPTMDFMPSVYDWWLEYVETEGGGGLVTDVTDGGGGNGLGTIGRF